MLAASRMSGRVPAGCEQDASRTLTGCWQDVWQDADRMLRGC